MSVKLSPTAYASHKFAQHSTRGAVLCLVTSPCALQLIPPGEAVPPDERAGGRRPPAARGIDLWTLVELPPRLVNRIDPGPCSVQLVAAHEERQYAVDDV